VKLTSNCNIALGMTESVVGGVQGCKRTTKSIDLPKIQAKSLIIRAKMAFAENHMKNFF